MSEITRETRSAMMAAVHSKGTEPEMVVRRLAHHLGYRFRIHGTLPGSPDIVFPSRRKVIFVHGCFWHRHTCKTGQRTVRTRPEFWERKFARNTARDVRNVAELRRSGWEALTIWECELNNKRDLVARLTTFLGPPGSSPKLTYSGT